VKHVTWLFAFLAAASAGAQERTLTIQSFDANIAVNREGVVDVTETITAQFTGSWNGLYRSIPVEYRTPQGFAWTLKLDFLGATDAEGRALKVERSRERHYLKYKIWIPGARDATRTIAIHYRAPNGLRFFEDHDELYWNVTGDEWDVPLNKVTAKVTLPPQTTGVRSTAFTGVYGSTSEDATITPQGNVLFLALNRNLGFREGATIVVGWDKGVVREPSGATKLADAAASNWPLSIPAAVLVGMFLLWRKIGRDPEALPVAVQYEPPGEMTPAEVGTLLDESVDMRDITATIVDLAVGGHLRIEEREEKTLLGLWSKSEFVFHRTQPPEGARALVAHEQRVLSGIFSGSAREVSLADLKNEFYTELPGIQTAVWERLADRGLHRSRPDKVRNRWTIAAVVTGAVLAFGAGGPFAARMGLPPTPFVVAGIVSGLIILLFSRIMPARTIAGARMLEKVRGFEEFLTRVESDRFARVVKTPEMFEKFLPFAMAFGVEAKWARAFRSIYTEPPTWYAGTNSTAFNAGSFSSRLSEMSEQAGKTMSSSPRSSGGSGFSGGSSGGGSGGGGGGGF
jgi:uncharacterized membrane protein